MKKYTKATFPTTASKTLRNAGIDLDNWLTGFDNVEDSVRHTVKVIRNYPLMPADIAVHGLVIHPTTGKLTLVVDGSPEAESLSDDPANP